MATIGDVFVAVRPDLKAFATQLRAGLAVALKTATAGTAVAGGAAGAAYAAAFIGQAAQAIGAAPVAAPFATAAIQGAATAKLAFSGVGDALKEISENGSLSAETLKKLSPAAADFARNVAPIQKELKGIRDEVQKQALPQFATAAKNASGLIPILRTELGKTGDTLGKLAIEGSKVTQTGLFRSDLRTIMSANTTIIKSLGSAGINVANAFSQVIAVAAPLAAELSKLAGGWSKNLLAEVEAERKSGELQARMETGVRVTGQLIRIVGNIFGTIANIFKAAGAGAGDVLTPVENVTKRMREFTGSVEFRAGAETVFHVIARTAGQVIDVLKLARTAVGNFVAGFRGNPVEKDLQNWHASVTKFGEGARTAFDGAKRGIKDVITGFSDPKAVNSMTGFDQALGRMGAGFRQTFDFVKKDVIPTIGKLGSAFATYALPPIAGLANIIRGTLIGALQPLLKVIREQATPFMKSFGNIMNEVVLPAARAIGGFITGTLAPALAKILGTALQTVSGFLNRMAKFAKDNHETLRILFGAIGIVASIITKTLTPVIQFLLQFALKPLELELKLVIVVFRTVLLAVLGFADGVLRGIQLLLSGVKGMVSGVLRGIELMLTGMGKIPIIGGPFRTAAKSVKDFRTSFEGDMQGAINTVGDARDAIKREVSRIAPDINEQRGNVSRASQNVANQVKNALGSIPRKVDIDVQARLQSILGKMSDPRNNATGGLIIGPGGPTEDKAGLFRLSNREYVQPARVVDRVGVPAMDALRAGRATITPIPGMAAGGVIGKYIYNHQGHPPSTDTLATQIGKLAAGNLGSLLGGFGVGGGLGGAAGVQRWAPVFAQALALAGQSSAWLGAGLRRLGQESGGNPTIVNKWDSNWLKGTPSVGLMQVIGPTFQRWAGIMRGVGPFLYGTSVNPLANIYAAIKYTMGAYGTLSAWGRPGGYRSGLPYVPYDGLQATLHRGERVLTATENQQYSGGAVHLTVHIHESDNPAQTQAMIEAAFARFLVQLRQRVGKA